MGIHPRDFKSLASTYSATVTLQKFIPFSIEILKLLWYKKLNRKLRRFPLYTDEAVPITPCRLSVCASEWFRETSGFFFCFNQKKGGEAYCKYYRASPPGFKFPHRRVINPA